MYNHLVEHTCQLSVKIEKLYPTPWDRSGEVIVLPEIGVSLDCDICGIHERKNIERNVQIEAGELEAYLTNPNSSLPEKLRELRMRTIKEECLRYSTAFPVPS